MTITRHAQDEGSKISDTFTQKEIETFLSVLDTLPTSGISIPQLRAYIEEVHGKPVSMKKKLK
jgi:hypothetical protein